MLPAFHRSCWSASRLRAMLRSLFSRLSPALMQRIEAESRTWFIQCQKCGHEISVWDAGGMRYKALGPVWRLARCVNCRRVGMVKIYRVEGSEF